MPSTWHGRTWPWERTGESLTAGRVTLEKRRTKLWPRVSPRAHGSVRITLPELAMSSIPSQGSLAPHLAILGQGFPFPPGCSACASLLLPPNSRPGHGLLTEGQESNQTQIITGVIYSLETKHNLFWLVVWEAAAQPSSQWPQEL